MSVDKAKLVAVIETPLQRHDVDWAAHLESVENAEPADRDAPPAAVPDDGTCKIADCAASGDNSRGIVIEDTAPPPLDLDAISREGDDGGHCARCSLTSAGCDDFDAGLAIGEWCEGHLNRVLVAELRATRRERDNLDKTIRGMLSHAASDAQELFETRAAISIARAERDEARAQVRRWEDKEVERAACCYENEKLAREAMAALAKPKVSTVNHHNYCRACDGPTDVCDEVTPDCIGARARREAKGAKP
jgi:hypothetical protein